MCKSRYQCAIFHCTPNNKMTHSTKPNAGRKYKTRTPTPRRKMCHPVEKCATPSKLSIDGEPPAPKIPSPGPHSPSKLFSPRRNFFSAGCASCPSCLPRGRLNAPAQVGRHVDTTAPRTTRYPPRTIPSTAHPPAPTETPNCASKCWPPYS